MNFYVFKRFVNIFYKFSRLNKSRLLVASVSTISKNQSQKGIMIHG